MGYRALRVALRNPTGALLFLWIVGLICGGRRRFERSQLGRLEEALRHPRLWNRKAEGARIAWRTPTLRRTPRYRRIWRPFRLRSREIARINLLVTNQLDPRVSPFDSTSIVLGKLQR